MALLSPVKPRTKTKQYEDGTDQDDDTPGEIPDLTFEQLGIADDLVQVLNEAGITDPFPVQVLTIPDALAGRDVTGKAQTGSGKTLAFGLPMIDRTTTAEPRRPHSLVLVPTRELANQVAEELTPLAAERGLWLSAIYGGVSMPRQIQALREGVDIVIATPGRLNDLLERNEISLRNVKFVVIDEADHMADMGFLPQVERILRQTRGTPQTLLFSATLDGMVATLVDRYQNDPVHYRVETKTATVETLEQRFIRVTSGDKIRAAARICAGAQRALVFVRTTHGADRLARQLGNEGLSAVPIHGRLSQAKRESTLKRFANGSTPVLVATNVAARGLHIDDIDLVLHFDPPEDHKVYLHRSGRTARAGKEGMVVTLVMAEQVRDVTRLEQKASIDIQIVKMASDDPRLLDLLAWDPPRGIEKPVPPGQRSKRRANWSVGQARPRPIKRPGRVAGGGGARRRR
ncbi:MAG: DEAD/DEAH box helicase [Dehalococcoidia bacterium]|nr:DEAD/DEAH box helicase [Dehalococcoidia bacterium]